MKQFCYGKQLIGILKTTNHKAHFPISQISFRIGLVLLMPFQFIQILAQIFLLFFPHYFRMTHNYLESKLFIKAKFFLTISISNIEIV
jgi:hypothetical protein